jgi:nucleotide-binding universal stress UspA family protein
MFDHILVSLDGSPLAECVLPHAVTLARAFGARITLLRVVERDSSGGLGGAIIDPLRWQVRKAEARAYLDELAARFAEAGLRVDTILLEGPAAERIIEFTRNRDVGLIIISTHGQSGLSGWNVSSVVQKVILRAHVPVMIVRAYVCPTTAIAEIRYRRLLVPLDGSQRAEHVLPLAATLAHTSGSQLVLAHVVSTPEVPRRTPPTEEESRLVDRLTELNRARGVEYLEQLQARFPPATEIRLVVSGDPAAALHDLVDQDDVDLVALSAHGYSGGIRWPYGSIALNFIAYGTTPLLIVQDLSPHELEKTRAEIAAKEAKGH